MSTISSREESLFADALAQPPAQRGAFLAKACGADAALLARIAALVAAHDGPESLMVSSEMARPPHALDEKPGNAIGHYKLLQKIGEGGCGVVWMAEQEEPVRRRVALKVIKLGMDTKAVVARFEAERQALAMMDHPNIAKVHDAGSTDTGRPYFVMELVRGIPITKYCDENHLTPKERLELFIKVCQAIQHAHQKGVIHRDIKPSNILVTVNDGAPTPKVIDFGIAKATQGKLTDATVFTAFEQFIGTPVYMSPEQAEMSSLDVDTRSDIYSLGVLLYELLTGRPPFDPKVFAQAGVDQIRQQIREREPAKPSRRLSTLSEDERTTIARLRNTASTQLSLLLRGDLDWIIMRCLEKDRTRRYDTANGLAMDIQRYLRNEPVVARPPNTRYLLQKLIRRHRVAFVASAVVAGVVLLGGIVSVWQAIRASRAERAAEFARTVEVGLRRTAETNELAARQRAYAADMNLVQQALAVDNLGRAKELLWRQAPQPGQRDLRGWEWRHLWQASQSDPHDPLEASSRSIWALAFSADGNWLAVGDQAGDLSVWNLRLRQKYRLPAGVSDVRAVFSPREPLLAISSSTHPNGDQASVELWNVTTRQMERRLQLAGACIGLFFSNDGETLVTTTSGGAFTRWPVRGGNEVTRHSTFPGMHTGVSVAVSPDIRLAAHPLNQGNEIRVMDLESGKERWRSVAADELTAAIAFSPDAKMLATGSGYVESVIRLWDVEKGMEIGRLEGHRSWVSALVFWPDGKTLGSASADQTIRLWDIPSRRLLRTFRGHKGEIYRLALHPDAAALVSGAKDGTVCLWDTNVLRPSNSVKRLPERFAAWRFGDGESVLTVDPAGAVVEWEGSDFQHKRELMKTAAVAAKDMSFGKGIDTLLYTARFSSERPLLAVGSHSGLVQVWDFERQTLAAELKVSTGRVVPVGFLGAGRRLVMYCEDDPITYREWDLVSGRETAKWAAPEYATVHGFTHTRDEKHALMIGFNGNCISRDLSSGLTRVFELPIHHAEAPRFSPDGRFLAVASQDGAARIWNVPDYTEAATYSGFILGVHSVAFSTDGSRLATGSNGAEAVRIWDAEGNLPLVTLEGTGSLFQCTAFSPNGRLLGSITNTGVLHLWRAPSWEEIAAVDKTAAAQPLRP